MVNVAKGFNLQCESIKKQKSYFLCNTKEGLFTIKKTNQSEKNIINANIVQNNLINNNFLQVGKFFLSSNGVPYFIYKNDTYIITDLTENACIDFDNNEMFLDLVTTLAKMHNKKNISNKHSPSLYYIYNNNVDNLSAIKRKLNNKIRLTDFDILFLKNYSTYIQDINEIYDKLKRTKYEKYKEISIKNCSICHNNLKKENIIYSNGVLNITNFFFATNDYYLNDISSIILNYIQYNNSPISINEIIKQYSVYNPINFEEEEILRIVLQYPFKFIKTVEEYYNKQRNYVPTSLLQRLNNSIQIRFIIKNYLSLG